MPGKCPTYVKSSLQCAQETYKDCFIFAVFDSFGGDIDVI